MQIKKINKKINMDEQFDVELQYMLNSYFCDVDCGTKYPRKSSGYILDLVEQLSTQGGVFKNPTQKQINKDKELCSEAGMTFCYVTGTKKTTGLW